jgi:hypothetical protein
MSHLPRSLSLSASRFDAGCEHAESRFSSRLSLSVVRAQ